MKKKSKPKPSPQEKHKIREAAIIKGIKEVSKLLSKHPSEITKNDIIKNCDNISSWDIRELGRFDAFKKAHFPITNKDLVTIRETVETNKYINHLEKIVGEQELFFRNMQKAVSAAVESIKLETVSVAKKVAVDKTKPLMTMEALISDIHYGKKTATFNLDVCRKRMKQFATVFLQEYEANKKSFNVHRFILAMLGDVIESYTMHGRESALGCEFGNEGQIEASIRSLFHDLILPIAKTGVAIDVPCIPGNHDRYDYKKNYIEMGRNHATWVIYNALQMLCEASGLDNVKWYITEGSYVVLPVYNNNVLYEHGDEANANTKNAFEAILNNRSQQEGVMLHFARFGHWHEYSCFERGRIIVNDSVCGQDGYAQQKGFASQSGQTINYYVETSSRPDCFYHSFPVYLA